MSQSLILKKLKLNDYTKTYKAIQVYVPISNTEEVEVEWLYKDLQGLLELTTKTDILFILGNWNAKVGSQKIPGITTSLALVYKM